jgi:hypothetical protein
MYDLCDKEKLIYISYANGSKLIHLTSEIKKLYTHLILEKQVCVRGFLQDGR